MPVNDVPVPAPTPCPGPARNSVRLGIEAHARIVERRRLDDAEARSLDLLDELHGAVDVTS
jgi:hypothetical protein